MLFILSQIFITFSEMTKEKSIYIQMLFQEDDRSDSKVLC